MKDNFVYILYKLIEKEDLSYNREYIHEFCYVLDKYREYIPFDNSALTEGKFCSYTREGNSLYFKDGASFLMYSDDKIVLLFKNDAGVSFYSYSIKERTTAHVLECMFDFAFLHKHQIDSNDLEDVYKFGEKFCLNARTFDTDILCDKMISYEICKKRDITEVREGGTLNDNLRYRINKECFKITKKENLVEVYNEKYYKDFHNLLFAVLDEARVDFEEKEEKINRFYMKKLGKKNSD